MTIAELTTLLRQEIKGLSSNFSSDDYTNAIGNAERDTGWSMPVSTDFKIQWMKQRATRHLFFFLLTESAHKFKYKQINLQHRFDHYKTLVKDMDASFEKAQEEIEQGKTERRSQKRHLQIHADHHPEPDEINSQGGGRHEKGNDDKRDLKEVDKEAQQKNRQIGHDEDQDRGAGSAYEGGDKAVNLSGDDGDEHGQEDHHSQDLL